jgi:glutaredoxin-related protein
MGLQGPVYVKGLRQEYSINGRDEITYINLLDNLELRDNLIELNVNRWMTMKRIFIKWGMRL